MGSWRWKLPVGRIILASLWLVYERRQALSRALVLPLAVLTAALFSFHTLTVKTGLFAFHPDDAILTTFLINTVYVLSFAVISAVFSAPFAIPCHRLIILGTDSVAARGRWRWTRRETRFALFGILFSAAMYFVLVILLVVLVFPVSIVSAVMENPLAQKYLVSYVGPGVAMTASSYIFCRLALIFPSVAIDEPLTIRSAWQMSHRNGWRLLIVIVTFFCVQFAVFKLIFAENLVFVFISMALFFTLSIVEIVALSLAYAELRKHVRKP